jgi:hypothetical protein
VWDRQCPYAHPTPAPQRNPKSEKRDANKSGKETYTGAGAGRGEGSGRTGEGENAGDGFHVVIISILVKWSGYGRWGESRGQTLRKQGRALRAEREDLCISGGCTYKKS